VFAGRGAGPLYSFSQRKRELDAKLKLPPWELEMPPWVLHDLRRTARSLMSRAGVSREHAERVLDHAIRGVEGVYDRHKYSDEKADALNRLAVLVERIVTRPQATWCSCERELRQEWMSGRSLRNRRSA
jgi:integrase